MNVTGIVTKDVRLRPWPGNLAVILIWPKMQRD